MKQSIATAIIVLGITTACSPETRESHSEANQVADLVLTNADVYTVDANRSRARSVAIDGDRIVYVGDDDGVAAFVGPDTVVRDLGGRLVLPGLHDMHIHAMGTVEPDMCDFRGEPKSLEQMVPFLKECISRYEIPEGEWLIVLQWPFSSGNQPSERLPTIRAALDAASEAHPIMLWGDDGHHGAANSAALARATNLEGNEVGLSKETLATVFADFREMVAVDENGEPAGGLSEGARLLVRPTFFEDMMGLSAEASDVMPRVAEKLASVGITSIQDPLVTAESLQMYDWLENTGQMTFRVRTGLFQQPFNTHAQAGLAQITEQLAAFEALRERYGDNPHMQVNAVKLFSDAVLEGNPIAEPPTLPVAAVLDGFEQPRFAYDREAGTLEIEGYVDTDSETCVEARAAGLSSFTPADNAEFRSEHGFLPAQCAKSAGVLEHSETYIREFIRQMTEAGFHVHVHALSDRAVRVVGQAFADVKDLADEHGLTQSVAHVQLAHPDDQRRLGELGVYVVFTYVWIFPGLEYEMMVVPFIDRVNGADDMYNPDHYYMKNVYPVKAVADAGAIPVFGSDAPVGTRDPIPFVSMLAALTREADGVVLNAQQKIGIDAIIDSYTISGARLMGHEQDLGSIEVGKIADLIVLDRNIVELAAGDDAAQIAETRVDLTVFEGRIVHEREST